MNFNLGVYNIWAVLVATVGNMVIGALWYSRLLFGKPWMALVGVKDDDISRKEANKSMSFSIIPAAVFSVLLAFLLYALNARTVLDALVVSLAVTVGFIGMSSVNLMLFENRPFKLVLINVGYSVVSLGAASVILTLWR